MTAWADDSEFCRALNKQILSGEIEAAISGGWRIICPGSESPPNQVIPRKQYLLPPPAHSNSINRFPIISIF